VSYADSRKIRVRPVVGVLRGERHQLAVPVLEVPAGECGKIPGTSVSVHAFPTEGGHGDPCGCGQARRGVDG